MTMIDIHGVSKTFGRQRVLKDISLRLEKKQSIALVGPNGSGKTTLIKAIIGLVLPESGRITVMGQDVSEGPAYRRRIGYMPQITRFPEQMRVSQLFDLMRKMRSDFSSELYDLSLYEGFDIAEYADKKLGTLSGGMKQQVSAALALYFSPSVIILDEPTAGLDPVSNEILKARVNQLVREDKLVITTSHILSDLEEISNHVVYLMDGEILFSESMEALRKRTSESKLSRIIVSILNAYKQDA